MTYRVCGYPNRHFEKVLCVFSVATKWSETAFSRKIEKMFALLNIYSYVFISISSLLSWISLLWCKYLRSTSHHNTTAANLYKDLFILATANRKSCLVFYYTQIRTFCGFFRWQIYATRRGNCNIAMTNCHMVTPNVYLHSSFYVWFLSMYVLLAYLLMND